MINIFNDFHQHFLMELLNGEVEFIVVGGMSVVFHGYIRTTGDMDLWIRPSNENKEKLLLVIALFEISEDSISRLKDRDFTEMLAFHFKNPPEKIEFLTKISGLHFDDAWSHCDYLKTDEFDIPFISFDDLIINKLSTGRLKDLADVEELQKIHPRGSG
jgi:hypothetical protein